MTRLIKTLLVVAAGAVVATSAFAQSAKDISGASPYVEITNEPAPKLIVDPPLREGLALGIYLGPVPSGELAHRTDLRCRRGPNISPGGASARNR